MLKFTGLAPMWSHKIRFDSDATKHTRTCLDSIQAASAMEIAGRMNSKENIGGIPMITEDNQMRSTNKSKVIRLEPWMEVIGPFVELEEQEGVLLADIAVHIIILPLDLKKNLMSHLGHHIGLLRTDISGKEYLVRNKAEEKSMASVEADVSELTKPKAQQEKASA